MLDSTPTTTSERPAMSTTEALRQAIAVLGYHAPAQEILAYAREHFGIGTAPEVAEVAERALPAAPPATSAVEPVDQGSHEPSRKPAARRARPKDRHGTGD